MTRWDFPEYLSVVEDRELDARAEQANREEVCGQQGHDIIVVSTCRRCGAMYQEEQG